MAFGDGDSVSSSKLLAVVEPSDQDIAIQHVPSAGSSVGIDFLLLVCFLVMILLVGFVLRLFLQMWRARIECQWTEDAAVVRRLV
ncbi:AGAP006664-PA [Anopheles gambiae str. PEST]|uniref:AGAP006664-PA n=2 Tax=gambiae species complex TaxID=44542 RepID=Q5TQT1_ANOGA|nr:AGAP006664-PA [Anopheles gambiae str. PEST]